MLAMLQMLQLLLVCLLPIALGSNYGTPYKNPAVFVAIAADTGKITSFGNSNLGGGHISPTDNDGTTMINVVSNGYAFAALLSNGTVLVWGDFAAGGQGFPREQLVDIQAVYTTSSAFCALKQDGAVVVWYVSLYLVSFASPACA